MSELQILFSGLLALLLAATIIAHVMDERRPSPSVNNLIARINAWWIMVVALAFAFALGRTAMVLLFAFASFNAMREFVTIAATRREDHLAVAAAFFHHPAAAILHDLDGLVRHVLDLYSGLCLPSAAHRGGA